MSYNTFYFGVPKSLTKNERNYLTKISKQELLIEAYNLGLMVDDKLTKPQLFNLIKQKRNEMQPPVRKESKITTQDLLDSLPYVPTPASRIKNTGFREQLDYVPAPSHRFPPGSKNIRKETGLTRPQKTAIRREITNEIDRLSDLLKDF